MSEESSSSYTPPKFCPQCGVEVTRKGARFCTKCGKSFLKASEGQQGSPPKTANTTTSTPNAVPQEPGQRPTGKQPGSSTYTGSMEQRPYGETSSQPRRAEMVTPNDIRPVSGSIFTKDELYIVLFFALCGIGSHILRYLLLFNEFPGFINLLFPIPLYFIASISIITIQKYFMRSKGIHVDIEVNRFDYTRSFVFSSFFLSLIPPRFTINSDKSNVPERLYITQESQHGMAYQEVSRSQYMGNNVRPYMHMFANFAIMVLGLIFLIFYINMDSVELQRVMRLVSLYISSFVLVELAPVFGRNNELSSEYGRIRTLLIFILNLIIFVLALLGETFFIAIQERIPI